MRTKWDHSPKKKQESQIGVPHKRNTKRSSTTQTKHFPRECKGFSRNKLRRTRRKLTGRIVGLNCFAASGSVPLAERLRKPYARRHAPPRAGSLLTAARRFSNARTPHPVSAPPASRPPNARKTLHRRGSAALASRSCARRSFGTPACPLR